jgi:hypothetical protein
MPTWPRFRSLGFALLAGASLTLAACATNDDPMMDDEGDDGTDTAAEGGAPCDPADDAVDQSSCVPLDTDYLPLDSDNDPYPACISDGGVYELVADPPSSIARVEAFETIADLLWRNGAPTAEDFTDARTAYDMEEGLGSRVERREDLHYPPIPEAEWDPGLDPDKQCSNTMLAEAYPDRCAGPAKLRPLVNQAFIDGQEGNGDPNVAAAKIEATLMWFFYISTYKEAYTCTSKGKDCDSSWAYYTGGAQVDGDVIGLANFVRQHSPETHQRIFDGVLAVRCFRDLYPNDMYATYDDLPTEGQELFDQAWEQLDNALHRGYAIVVRQHLLAQDDEQCSEATAANWAFLQIAGPVLDREAQERDPDAAAELAAIWALEEPTTDDLEQGAALIDQIFPCP